MTKIRSNQLNLDDAITLADGTAATTQISGDSSDKVATTAFVESSLNGTFYYIDGATQIFEGAQNYYRVDSLSHEKVLTGALQDIHLCIGSSKIAQISLHIEILQDKEALKDEIDI